LDRTKTAFGRRLLKKWILAPLYSIPKINERLDAVEDLMRHPELVVKFQEFLRAVSACQLNNLASGL
jgi:DNA mismatch repair ATPase MutS